MKLLLDSMCSVKRNDALAEVIKRSDLNIWDEAPNMGRLLLEAVERTDRDIRDDDSLFGGASWILAGDFRQVFSRPLKKRGVMGCVCVSVEWWGLECSI